LNAETVTPLAAVAPPSPCVEVVPMIVIVAGTPPAGASMVLLPLPSEPPPALPSWLPPPLSTPVLVPPEFDEQATSTMNDTACKDRSFMRTIVHPASEAHNLFPLTDT
jgi:hypothetical protein